MNNKQRITPPHCYVNLIPSALFTVSVIISILTTYYVCSHYIDSDASSELVLAQHWIETRNPLSPDWLYGSELRLFHIQLIYVPLMFLLDDWLMVRYIGALIMQGLYIASFACLVRAAGKSRSFFFYGAALLLLPVSVAYGRIVLYHNHYLPNITISFFLVALTLPFAGEIDWRSKKTWLRLLFLAMLSFAGGLNSIRQLSITHAPLLLTAVVSCWIEDAHNEDRSKTALLKSENLNFLFCCIYATVFSLLGLKIHNVLCDKLGLQIFVQVESKNLGIIDATHINEILYGFFHQFGFRDQVPMLSINGLLSLGSIFTGCYLLFISANRLMKCNVTEDKRKAILSTFFLAHTTVLLLVFFVTSGYLYPLYLTFCFPWAVPLILTHLEELPTAIHPLRAKKLFAFIAVIALLASGVVNLSYFHGSKQFPQIYEGLSFKNKDKKEELTEVVIYLTEHGYDKGYADHWEGSIVTEMTDGNMPMVVIDYPSDPADDAGNLYYASFLCSLWLQESPCEKPFLLLPQEDEIRLLQSDSIEYCTKIYSGHQHVAYSIDNLEAFADTLRY